MNISGLQRQRKSTSLGKLTTKDGSLYLFFINYDLLLDAYVVCFQIKRRSSVLEVQ